MKQSIKLRGKTIPLSEFEALPDEEYRHYSAEEEELIRKWWPIKKTRDLAKLLNRDAPSLNEKARRMGLTKKECREEDDNVQICPKKRG